MKLAYERNLFNNEYSMKVYIKSFGTQKLTPEEEVNILENYNKILRYRDIDFTGYFKKDGSGNIISATTTVTYIAKLNVEVPTNITTGTGVDEYIAKIGNKEVSITSSSSTPSEDVIKNSVLEAIKTDSIVLDIFEASDIKLEGSKIVAEKSSNEVYDNSKIQAINDLLGNESVKVDENSSTDGIRVTLGLVDKKLVIKEGFEAYAEIRVSQIKDSEVSDGYSKEQIAEMKMLLFRNKIYEEVKKQVEKMKEMTTDYEDTDIEENNESEEF